MPPLRYRVHHGADTYALMCEERDALSYAEKLAKRYFGSAMTVSEVSVRGKTIRKRATFFVK